MTERVVRQQQFFWELEKKAPKKTFIVPCRECLLPCTCALTENQCALPSTACDIREVGATTAAYYSKMHHFQGNQMPAEIGVSMIFQTDASISPVLHFSPCDLCMRSLDLCRPRSQSSGHTSRSNRVVVDCHASQLLRVSNSFCFTGRVISSALFFSSGMSHLRPYSDCKVERSSHCEVSSKPGSHMKARKMICSGWMAWLSFRYAARRGRRFSAWARIPAGGRPAERRSSCGRGSDRARKMHGGSAPSTFFISSY